MLPTNTETFRLQTAKKAVSDIRDFTAGLDFGECADLGMCSRPKRELRDLEDIHYKQHGYSSKARLANPIRTIAGFARSAGSIALFYGSAEQLEYRSHRFIMSEETTTYHRESYNVDSQSVGSQDVDLGSLQQIVVHGQAYDELLWLRAELRQVQGLNWAPNSIGFVACRM